MIYLYISTKGISDVDLSMPENGNPGIGGTQYCFILLAYYLYKNNNLPVNIISLESLKLPAFLKNIVVSDFIEACRYVQEKDILICQTPMNKVDYDIINTIKGKVICWSHNYFKYDYAKLMSSTKKIVANVFVSKQMFDFYIDCDIIKKSLYIFNMVPDTLGECKRNVQPNTLVFIGNLIKEKGIIELFKIWRRVEKKVPNAQLYIIGRGNLYDHTIKLGKINVLSEDMEQRLSSYIFDSDNKIKKNIHFLGILGKEKYDVFLNASVGMVNPSAKTETFGLGIVEMATAKLPVVTMNWNGHPDTAINKKTALLSLTNRGMAKNVIKLFSDNDLNKTLGENGKLLCSRFSPSFISQQWYDLISNIENGSYINQNLSISKPYWNNYKFIRKFISILRLNCRIKIVPPIVYWETKINDLIKNFNGKAN